MLSKKVIFVSSDKDGCGWYRTKLIADYLQQGHSWFFPTVKDDSGNLRLEDEAILSSDVIVIQRHVHEFFLTLIPYLQSIGKKVVYDLDDNLWSIPSSNPAHHFFPSKVLKTTKRIIQLCDHVTVSTAPLRDYMLKEGFNTRIVIVPNMLQDVFEYKEKNNDKIRIGYCGSPTHAGDFNFKLCDALRAMKKNHDCELVFLGYNPVKGYETEWSKGVEVKDYLTTLQSMNLDIAIAPLDNNLFNQCKSNLKFLEYSACGIATVASCVYPYSTTINAHIGSLVAEDKQWIKSLELLASSKEFRDKSSFRAWEFVRDNFTYKHAGHKIVDIWEGIIKEMYDIH